MICTCSISLKVLTICSRYRETVQEDHSGDESDSEEYDARRLDMDSDDDHSDDGG